MPDGEWLLRTTWTARGTLQRQNPGSLRCRGWLDEGEQGSGQLRFAQLVLFAGVVGANLGIHHGAPQRGKQSEDDHPGVTVGQLRAVVEVAQHLVAALGVGVMVGVALQVKQKQVGQQEVAVPGVVRVGAFIAAVFQFASMQAIVFDVVDDFQQGERHHRLAEEEQCTEPAEGQRETE